MDGGDGKPRRTGAKPAYLGWFLLCLAFYVVGVATFGYVSHHRKKTALLKEIDDSLLLAARSLKYMLAPDFHDRALGPASISREEELRNRAAFSGFWEEAGLKWVYTLVERDGSFYFSGPAVSKQEALERPSWFFYPYEEAPAAFAKALAEEHAVFVEYTDRWGDFRSVALPQRSPIGRPYLACADLEVSHIRKLLRRNDLETASTVLFLLGCSLPFVGLLFRDWRKLRSLNAEVTKHRDHLEELVEKRTQELRQALAEVKTLHGLLPICAACKKIRDDQGSWNPVEAYVESHSEAAFTHGLCPDCARHLYPEYPADADTQPGS